MKADQRRMLDGARIGGLGRDKMHLAEAALRVVLPFFHCHDAFIIPPAACLSHLQAKKK
jgi:hypothetical protein